MLSVNRFWAEQCTYKLSSDRLRRLSVPSVRCWWLRAGGSCCSAGGWGAVPRDPSALGTGPAETSWSWAKPRVWGAIIWLSVAGRGGPVGSSSAKQDQGVGEQQVLRESAVSCGREAGSAGPVKPMLSLCPAHVRLLVGAVFFQGFPE